MVVARRLAGMVRRLWRERDPLRSRLALRRYLAARRMFDVDRIAVDGTLLTTRWAGPHDEDAPDLVLLAGLGLSGRDLLPCAAHLAEHWRVWVPDLPGHARRRRDRPPVDMAELAQLVRAWMDAAGIDRVAVVGNSMGCQVAVELAAAAPERVTHLVLHAPTMDRSARTLRAHIPRVARDTFREPASLGPLQVRDWIRAGPGVLRPLVRCAFAHAVEARLESVVCPALVVRGSRDPIVPQGWAEEVAEWLPHGALHVVEGGTHALPYSSPEVLADLVTRFVRTGRSGEV